MTDPSQRTHTHTPSTHDGSDRTTSGGDAPSSTQSRRRRRRRRRGPGDGQAAGSSSTTQTRAHDDARSGDSPHTDAADAGRRHPDAAVTGHRSPSSRPPADLPVPEAFQHLGLSDDILQAIAVMGYEEPTPIQAQAIPQVLAGRDVLGCAQTGTGKTAAFVLPILQRIEARKGLQALVVTPTRELAAQIDEVARAASTLSGHRIAAVFGGTAYEPSAQKVRRGIDLLVATPGRLLDMVQRGDVKLGTAQILVLDEADRMLDMGFWPDVRRIISKLPPKRQNLLFSATLSRSMLDVIRDTLTDPVRVQIGEAATPVDEVLQQVYPVVSTQKMDLLIEFLHHHKPERALIFTRTKHRADRLARVLSKNGIKGTTMHSNRTQSQREQALDGFKNGKYSVLVATDIVARGIDVEGISHVVNYDIPLNAEDYVHRIGRTARAGADGIAVSFLTAEEVHELKAIERLIGADIDRHDLPGFDYEHRHIPESKDVPRKPGKSLWRGGVKRGGRSFLRGHAH